MTEGQHARVVYTEKCCLNTNATKEQTDTQTTAHIRDHLCYLKGKWLPTTTKERSWSDLRVCESETWSETLSFTFVSMFNIQKEQKLG